MSDNLLTSVIRAWDTDGSIDNKKKVIVVAPAMNSVGYYLVPPFPFFLCKKRKERHLTFIVVKGNVEASYYSKANPYTS
jgi:hypothetical protein